MTKETRLIVGLGDIQAVRIQCESCGEVVLSSLNPTGRLLPSECPWCGSFWREEQTVMGKMFLEALLNLRNQRNGAVVLKLELGTEADLDE